MRAGAAILVVMTAAALAIAPAAAAAQAVETSPLPTPRPGSAPGLAGESLRALAGHSGRSGWLLADVDTGEVLAAHAPDAAFAPASVAKLATALYALDMLGPGHRFETRLLARGAVSPGVLRGDLILAGGGDPELDSDRLVGLVAQARRAGLARVEGRFLVDGGGAVRAPAIDPRQPVDAAYNPGVSALNLNFNRVRLRWGGAADLSLTAEADRLAPPVELVGAARAEGGGPLFQYAREEGRARWRIAAEALSGRGARWLPVKRPALYAGDVFRALAAQRGLALPQPATGTVPAQASLVARIESRTLERIVADMMRYSTNLTAEAVGVAASRAAGAVPATLADSGRLMSAWAGRLARPHGGGRPDFRNHSGLTAESRVTPRDMVAFLIAAARRVEGDGSAAAGPLAPLLEAVALEGPASEGATVRAKSGTMDHIRGLAGCVLTEKGRRLAFAVFSNDLPRREGARRRIDRGWMGRARWFERRLLSAWLGALRDDARGDAARVEAGRAG